MKSGQQPAEKGKKMKIGYCTERLHHALHPLFLTISPGAEWEVGPDREDMDWYFQMQLDGYEVRNPGGQEKLPLDMYALKRYCYDYYRDGGLFLPWGIISGIRPTKLSRQIYEQVEAMTFEDFRDKIWKLDRVSPEKADLLWQVLQTENEYLSRINADQPSAESDMHLYVGIPFCPSRCYYCSFSAGIAHENDVRLKDYVTLLQTELEDLKPIWQKRRIRSLYIGGGTPTILNETLLIRLLDKIAAVINLDELEEFTVEAGRPDTISPTKLNVLKDYQVNRISINPQTFSDQTLARIGRGHTVDDVLRAYEWAGARDFLINMDLIFGLPGEGLAEVEKSFRYMEKLRPDNITVHTLTPKRGADLSQEQKAGIWQASHQIGEMLNRWQAYMNSGGWRPYYLYRQKNIYFENVGYALPGREGIYNMETMLEKRSILALGAGSISKKVEKNKISRYDMPKQMEAYRRAVTSTGQKKLNFFIEKC
ncbi:coproporphyrinogen dehydrogenase HemZ [Clostridiales bacterium COT073_COT-073]|nr:coproporphyrinogen dehydrogenase HemZ [Clostridiales bacterium COT073_COT-073]